MYSLTRIAKENEEYFEDLLPEGGLKPGDQALGVFSEEEDPVAASVFRKEGKEVSLEWLFVDPDYRRQGIGLHLVGTAEELINEKVDMIRLSYYSDTEGMEELLQKLGYYTISGNTVYRITPEDLADNPEYQKMQRMPVKKEPVPLDRLLREERAKLLSFLSAEYRGTELLSECDPAHSFCIAEEDGSYSGCILTKKLEEDLFQILLLYNTGGVMQAIVLLKAFLTDGMSITFVEANSHVKSLAESLEKGREKKLQKKQLKIAVKRICE